MKNINCSMVRRELAALKRHECICGSGSGNGGNGGSGNGNGSGESGSGRRTYDLKIIMIDSGDGYNKDDRYLVYIDKSPNSVYAAFAELIKQKYYIKYAEGTTSVHYNDGGDQLAMDNIPSIYTGTCIAGSNLSMAITVPSKPELYRLSFNFDEYTIDVVGIPITDGTIRGVITFTSKGIEISNGGEVFQYNNEDLGDNYTIWDLTFIWESLD